MGAFEILLQVLVEETNLKTASDSLIVHFLHAHDQLGIDLTPDLEAESIHRGIQI